MDIGISCAGRCPCQTVRVFVRVCGRMCVCVCGHEAVGMLRWQMALLHCRATLANRGRTGRRWERKEEMGCESKREMGEDGCKNENCEGGVSSG